MTLRHLLAAATVVFGLHAAPALAQDAAIDAMSEYMMPASATRPDRLRDRAFRRYPRRGPVRGRHDSRFREHRVARSPRPDRRDPRGSHDHPVLQHRQPFGAGGLRAARGGAVQRPRHAKRIYRLAAGRGLQALNRLHPLPGGAPPGRPHRKLRVRAHTARLPDPLGQASRYPMRLHARNPVARGAPKARATTTSRPRIGAPHRRICCRGWTALLPMARA